MRALELHLWSTVDCLLWREGGPGTSRILGSSSQVMQRWSVDGQAVWGSICGNAGAVPDHCGEEKAEHKAKLFFFFFTSLPTFQPSPMVLSSK